MEPEEEGRKEEGRMAILSLKRPFREKERAGGKWKAIKGSQALNPPSAEKNGTDRETGEGGRVPTQCNVV